MVKSTTLYTTQSYCDEFLGFCPVVRGGENELRNIIDRYCEQSIWDFPLDEVDEIVHNNCDVVLVDTSYIDDECNLVHEYRWFEVPDIE